MENRNTRPHQWVWRTGNSQYLISMQMFLSQCAIRFLQVVYCQGWAFVPSRLGVNIFGGEGGGTVSMGGRFFLGRVDMGEP